MNKIHISNITDITKDKIYYRDDNGDVAFIDLETCASNYEAINDVTYKQDSKHRCVGERLFGFRDYAYYELYTDERTHLYLELKTNAFRRFVYRVIGWNFYVKDYQLFYSVQERLNNKGWTTLDLS
ncbi:MAG: hypothetical protein IJY79_06430 [Clostridia bacterium]|nr:hypothetical protein [Clostridia bacterium]